MKKYRPVAIMLAAAMMMGLVACSSGTGTSGGGKTQLVVWDSQLLTKVADDGKVDVKTSFLHQAAANYEKTHPDVSIKIVQTSRKLSTSAAQFQAASIARNGPDIKVGYTGGSTNSFGKYFIDLNPVFSDATKADLSGWNTVREGFKSDGKLLALPYGAGSYFYVFYNKQKVKAADIDLSSPPASWEDLLAMGQKAKAAGQVPFWVANQEGYVGAWVVAALTGGELGGSAFTDMYNGKIPVDNPGMLKAYEGYAQLYSRNLTNPDAGSVANENAADGFIQGKGTFFICGDWDNAQLEKAMGDSVGVFPIPMLADAKYPKTAAGGPNEAISITNYSKHLDAAKAFVKYLAEPATIDLYVKINQKEASNSSRADPSVITNALLKSEAEQLKQQKDVVFPFDNVMPQAVIDLFYKLNATVFLGTTTPQDTLKQLEASYKKEIAKQ